MARLARRQVEMRHGGPAFWFKMDTSHTGRARLAMRGLSLRGPWTDYDLQRVHDFRVTPTGHSEAERVRRLRRQEATDIAFGRRSPSLMREWMADAQRRALAAQATSLETALDEERTVEAIGAAKNLLEAILKISIEHTGGEVPRAASLVALYRQAIDALPALETDVGRRLSATVQRLSEVRNDYGAGHGKASIDEVPHRYAFLAASAALTVARFVLDEHEAHLPSA